MHTVYMTNQAPSKIWRRPEDHTVRKPISVPMVRFDAFFVEMISTSDSRYPISFVKIDSLTLE